MSPTVIDPAYIGRYLRETFANVEVQEGAPYTFFFIDPERKFPFVTIATGDHESDRLSQLDREGAYRLNIGVDPATFRARFGAPGEATETDYAALDRLMPHPVYASWGWVCVVNPSAATFEALKPLIAEAYAVSKRRHVRT